MVIRRADRIDYDALIREALCWGWIDGPSKGIDADRSMLWFTPRRARSPWSGTNKRRVADLEREGRLQPAGIAAIAHAKATGLWTLLDSAEAGIEPDDLTEALAADPAARAAWDGWPPVVRKQVLTSLLLARSQATRASRIARVVASAAAGTRP